MTRGRCVRESMSSRGRGDEAKEGNAPLAGEAQDDDDKVDGRAQGRAEDERAWRVNDGGERRETRSRREKGRGNSTDAASEGVSEDLVVVLWLVGPAVYAAPPAVDVGREGPDAVLVVRELSEVGQRERLSQLAVRLGEGRGREGLGLGGGRAGRGGAGEVGGVEAGGGGAVTAWQVGGWRGGSERVTARGRRGGGRRQQRVCHGVVCQQGTVDEPEGEERGSGEKGGRRGCRLTGSPRRAQASEALLLLIATTTPLTLQPPSHEHHRSSPHSLAHRSLGLAKGPLQAQTPVQGRHPRRNRPCPRPLCHPLPGPTQEGHRRSCCPHTLDREPRSQGSASPVPPSLSELTLTSLLSSTHRPCSTP